MGQAALPQRQREAFLRGSNQVSPLVRARQGLIIGIRQPLDGLIFQTITETEHWCIHAMIRQFDRAG